VEDHEALETCAVVGELSDAIKDKVDDLLADGIVTTSIVVGGIFLARNQLLRVVKLAISSGSNLVTDSGLKVYKHSTRDVFTCTSLREKSIERIITASNGFVGGHLAIRLNAVFQTVQFPTGISGLDSGLANMNRDNFTHFELKSSC